MNRKDAEAYTTQAIEALEQCKTDADLVAWDHTNTNNHQYLSLPDDLVKALEEAYDKRVRWVVGFGAG